MHTGFHLVYIVIDCLCIYCRAEACAHQQAAASWRGEGERMQSALADARRQLQETRASHGNTYLSGLP